MSIKLRLDEVLDEQGITNKTALAKELDMSRWGLFKHISNEATRIDLATIEKYCRALDITPNELFSIQNEDGTPFVPSRKRKRR